MPTGFYEIEYPEYDTHTSWWSKIVCKLFHRSQKYVMEDFYNGKLHREYCGKCGKHSHVFATWILPGIKIEFNSVTDKGIIL